MADIKLPHNYSARWYQKELWQAMKEYKRIFYLAHRRTGKDFACWNIMISKAIQEKGIYWYILPTREQARKVIWDAITNDGVKFLDCIPKELIAKIDQSSKVIYLINGSTIWLLGADADSLVGANPRGIVFSEYAVIHKDPWGFIQPILQMNGGWAIFNTTPRGTNHAHTLMMQAKTNPNWKVIEHPVTYTKVLTDEQLEEIRKETTQDLFDQEFLLKFVDSASQVFKNPEQATYYYDEKTRTNILWDGNLAPHQTENKDKKYRIGLDLAKLSDFTVLTPICLHTFRVAKQDVFNQIDYPTQRLKIVASHYQYNQAVVNMDNTGIGEPIGDDLEKEMHGKVNRYTFTYQFRYDLLTNLAILLEQRKITIPNDPELLHQLKSFQWEITPSRKLTMKVPEGVHDDLVFSLALAVWELPSTKKPLPEYSELKDDVRLFDANRRTEYNGTNKYR
jgi:hypothetical protein